MKDKKLVTVLIVIIVLLLIGGAYMFGVRPPNNYEVYKGGYPNLDNSQLPKDYSDKTTGDDTWITDSKMGLIYNSKWQVTPEMYRTPAQQENGEPLSIVGYRFTLPSGNTISYGGRQNGCTMSEAQNEALIFKYGISQSTCIKGMKAYLGLSDVRKTLPQEDINSFGDFVLRNQDKIITQQEAENLVRTIWSDCSKGDCGGVKVTISNNNTITAVYTELDDSVAFSKREAHANYQDGMWVLGIPTITNSCHLNRGHQDFSNVPCI